VLFNAWRAAGRRTISSVSTRFFRTALTTGMTGSSIDPDLAASLKARDRHADSGARSTRRSATGFSTLLFGRTQPAEPQPYPHSRSAWRCLRRALKRLSAN
jgi:hypothetical protein